MQNDGAVARLALPLPVSPSAQNIDVKEITAARTVRVLDKSPIEENIRNSERPEFGVVVLEKDPVMRDTDSIPSDDHTATSSPVKPLPLGLPQGPPPPSRKPRKGLRDMLKAVF